MLLKNFQFDNKMVECPLFEIFSLYKTFTAIRAMTFGNFLSNIAVLLTFLTDLTYFSLKSLLLGFSTSFSTSLSTSMSEDMMVASYRPHIDWYDMQTQLLQDVELTASLKSSQPNIVNRIITNANYSPDWYVCFLGGALYVNVLVIQKHAS